MRMLSLAAIGGLVYLVSRRACRTVDSFKSVRRPSFYYRNVKAEELGIPVFTYHSIGTHMTPDSVTAAQFESHVRHLAQNGYRSLTADELYDCVVQRHPCPPKGVAVTFDDGRASLWVSAFPILKKYGIKAISFVNPGLMSETGTRPTIEDCCAPEQLPQCLADVDLVTSPVSPGLRPTL